MNGIWPIVAIIFLAAINTAILNHKLQRERTAHAETKADWAQQVADSEVIHSRHVQAILDRERGINAEFERIRAEAGQRVEAARRDAVRAGAIAQRLRQQIRTTTARACPAIDADTAPALGSPSTGPATDMLDDVLRRLDEAASDIARHADDARTAGLACERAYRSLSGSPAP